MFIKVRKIKHLRVFFITAAWSLVAYLGLYLIVGQITPGRVDVWEGVVTFLFFPLTVYMAFVADRRLYFFKYLHKKYRTGSRGVIVQTEKEDHVNINHVNEEEAVGTSVKEETNLNNLLEQRNGSIVEDGAQSTIGDTVIFKDKSNFLLGVNNWKNQFIDVLKIDNSDTDDEKVEEMKSSEKSHVLERSISSHVWRGTGHYVYHILVFRNRRTIGEYRFRLRSLFILVCSLNIFFSRKFHDADCRLLAGQQLEFYSNKYTLRFSK